MATADIDQQWRELRETYSLMTEEELRQVADDAFDLTPIAREALQAVIAEKGFKVHLVQAPVREEPKVEEQEDEELAAGQDNGVPETEISPEDDLISVCTLKSEADAKQAKAILDASFIASCLGPDNIVDLENFKGSFDGGVDLKVFSDFARRASQALKLYAPELKNRDDLPQGDDDWEYTATCPRCKSEDIIFEGHDPQPGDGNRPGDLHWTCSACGHQWDEEGIGPTVE